MISNSKYFSNIIDDTFHRVMKVLGMNGAATADHVTPFGDDSVPVQGMDAIYAETASDELPIIIGYINTNAMAAEGEKRLFSLTKVINIDGSINYVESFYTWHKNDGTYEIGGNTDNAVRYSALNTALQNEITALNSELTKIQLAITSLGGTYTRLPVSLNITAAKINEIKTL